MLIPHIGDGGPNVIEFDNGRSINIQPYIANVTTVVTVVVEELQTETDMGLVRKTHGLYIGNNRFRGVCRPCSLPEWQHGHQEEEERQTAP